VASLVSIAGLGVAGCIVPSISTGAADGGSSSSSSSSDDAGSPTAVTGTGCAAVTSTVTLCQTISLCPSLTLNAKVFPQCGFRIHDQAIDPECICGNQLCPIGAPTTCTEASQLSSGDVNYDSVCQEANVGQCTSLSTGSSSGGTSTACQMCIANCDNVPTCVDGCPC
ncbi:MAG TPA: hypothetical protein VGI39_22070, partial [Polyangiaceae bacterium]|jgi:hypothetical protein